MCMLDYDSCSTAFSSHSTPRARKPHLCDECGRVIDVGEVYKYAAGHTDGDFWTAKMCAHCQVAASWLQNNCGGYLFHAVHEDFSEHAIGNLAMLRVVVGARRRWKLFAGDGLMALPGYPADMEAEAA